MSLDINKEVSELQNFDKLLHAYVLTKINSGAWTRKQMEFFSTIRYELGEFGMKQIHQKIFEDVLKRAEIDGEVSV